MTPMKLVKWFLLALVIGQLLVWLYSYVRQNVIPG